MSNALSRRAFLLRLTCWLHAEVLGTTVHDALEAVLIRGSAAVSVFAGCVMARTHRGSGGYDGGGGRCYV